MDAKYTLNVGDTLNISGFARCLYARRPHRHIPKAAHTRVSVNDGEGRPVVNRYTRPTHLPPGTQNPLGRNALCGGTPCKYHPFSQMNDGRQPA